MSVYLLAELGSVPDGSIGNCLALIDACAAAGVDAIKLQDHLGERIKGDPPWFKPGHETREQYLKRTTFDDMQWQLIRARCTERKVDLVVSPFSVEAVRRLELVPVDGYKVASGQVTNLEVLKAIGETGKRVFLSSGMTTTAETIAAMRAVRSGHAAGAEVELTLMHCVSAYPCPPEKAAPYLMDHWRRSDRPERFYPMARGFGTLFNSVGYSDHTMGVAASLAAIALGASAVERHVGFDRRGFGSDAKHSLTLDELAAFVREARDLDVMMNTILDKDAIVETEHMRNMRAAFLERA